MKLSLRAYSRHRLAAGLTGGTLRAVQVAIRDGRLSKSLTEDRKIRSTAEADAEWAATTYEDRIPITGPTAPKPAPVPTPNPLREPRVRREAALAETAEIELAKLKGEYIRTDKARADVINAFTIVKTRLLAVPSLLAQRWPRPPIDREVIRVVDELIREALEELSFRGQRDHKPDDTGDRT